MSLPVDPQEFRSEPPGWKRSMRLRPSATMQRAVVGDGERADRAQLAGTLPGGADRAQELPLRREDLDDVRALVADVDVAVGADRDRLGEAQHAAGALADLRRRDVDARGLGAGALGHRGLRGDERREEASAQGEEPCEAARSGTDVGGHQGVEHAVPAPDAGPRDPHDAAHAGRRRR